MTPTESSVWSLGLALALATLHLAAPRIRTLRSIPERKIGSFAGGLAVSYVFLHLLPELAAGNDAIGEVLHDVVELTPLIELGIFAVALAGFLAFYGLERLAELHAGRHPSAEPGALTYGVHLGSFVLYNALITYSMALRLRTGIMFALLFTVAMGLHFVLIDRGLAERYPRRFRSSGRYTLAGALLAGWVLATVFAPTSTVVVSLLTAFLAGAVLLNVFKEEIPSARRSSFPWFLAGLVLYGVLLALVTLLGE